MSSLANQQQNLSFPGLLQVPGGITSTLQQVQDGNGNATGLSLSSAGASVTTSSTFQASKNGITLTGALPRLISDGFGDLPTVKDFGAVGNGVTDDTAAFTAAIAASPTGVAVPAGSYKITGTVTGAFYSFGTVTVVTGTVTSIQNVSFPYTSSSGSSLIGTIQSGTGAVARTVASKLNDNINVRDFGAVGDGVADDTVAIQAAINAAGVNGTIIIPSGIYLLTATLNGLVNQTFIGSGSNSTIFRRFANYGNTLYFANAGASQISGIWFWHGSATAPPATGTLPDLVTTGAHIRCGICQGLVIEDCWMWRLQWGVLIDTGAIIRINRCSIQGIWSRFNVNSQEGIAGIGLGVTGYSQLVEITNCYFGGANSGPQSLTFTSSDTGAHVVNFSGTNAGNQSAIIVFHCEGLLISGNYMGGNAYNCLNMTPNGIVSQVRIHNNFFDGAGYDSSDIYIATSANGLYSTMVTISDNCFNDELICFNCINTINPYGSDPVMTNFTITGNDFSNSLGSATILRSLQGGVISSNSFTGYNSRNITAGADQNYGFAISMFTSTSVTIDGNILGGNVNSDAINSFTYSGIYNSLNNTNVVEQNSLWNGLGASANKIGRADKIIAVVTTTYTIKGYESLILATVTANGVQITLPTNIATGYTCTIKDGSGNFATYNVGIIGTIDGVVNKVMITNYQTLTVMWNGTQWNII